MGQNTLTPHLDKSLNALEISPFELEELHTKIHTIYDGLSAGRYFDDWTIQDCKRVHSEIEQAYWLNHMTLEAIKPLDYAVA